MTWIIKARSECPGMGESVVHANPNPPQLSADPIQNHPFTHSLVAHTLLSITIRPKYPLHLPARQRRAPRICRPESRISRPGGTAGLGSRSARSVCRCTCAPHPRPRVYTSARSRVDAAAAAAAAAGLFFPSQASAVCMKSYC